MGRNFNTPRKKEQGTRQKIAASFLISSLIRQEDHYFRTSYWFWILVAKSSCFLSHSVLYLILSFYFVNLIRPLRAVSRDLHGSSTTWFQTSRYCRAKVEFNSIN